MKDQIGQVAQLFEKKKYKKALLILNKINKKQPDYASLHYTAACYYYEKRYAQADIYYAKALKLATDDNDKINILSDLAVTQVHLGKQDKAIEYYVKVLERDGSVATAVHRDSLCRLAGENQNHQIIFDYAPKLLGWFDYAKSGLYLLLQSHLQTSDNDKDLELYFKKLCSEIVSYNSEHALSCVELILSSNNADYINRLAVVVEKKFSHEKWFKQFKAQQESQSETADETLDIPENRVVGDNQKSVEQIEALLAHCESIGAWFHPKLRVIEAQGALSVKVFDKSNDNQKMIEIPYKGLPLLRDFAFELDDNGGLKATPVAAQINPSANETMALLQDIYNGADKLNHWADTFAFSTLKNHEVLLKKLCAAKPNFNKVKQLIQQFDAGQFNEMVIQSFFDSRKMMFKQEDLKAQGIITENAQEPGLLSVIDFLNHKIASNPYQTDIGKLSVSGQVDPESLELFVHYNNYDPLMTYLFYGFVDGDASFVYSIPVELELLNGQKILVLDSMNKVDAAKVPEGFSHLREYLPEISNDAEGIKQLSKLMVPDTEESHLLREVLSVALGSLGSIDALAIEQEVLHLEKQVIANNMAYWQEVERLLKDAGIKSSALDEVKVLVDFYQSHYQKYSAKFGIQMF